MQRLRYTIGIPPGYEELVANLFLDNDQWGAITQEKGEILLVLYPSSSGAPWSMGFSEVMEMLHRAEADLKNRPKING